MVLPVALDLLLLLEHLLLLMLLALDLLLLLLLELELPGRCLGPEPTLLGNLFLLKRPL